MVCNASRVFRPSLARIESHGKIRPQLRPLNHRKADSPSKGPQFRTAAQGISYRKEIERLQDAARKRSRYGHRDATMILLTYRHGLRASEVCSLRWDQIELESGRLHVRRAKGGIDNVHPLSGKEIRALRQLRRENPESRYVFITERGGPATTAGFLKTIARTGEAAGRALLRRGKRHRGTARIAAQGTNSCARYVRSDLNGTLPIVR
jgi:integrase